MVLLSQERALTLRYGVLEIIPNVSYRIISLPMLPTIQLTSQLILLQQEFRKMMAMFMMIIPFLVIQLMAKQGMTIILHPNQY